MCGYDLRADRGAVGRRISLPIADLILVAVILAVAYLWWTRTPADTEAVSGATPPPAVATPTPAVALTSTATASPVATQTATQTPTVTPTPTPVLYTVVRGDTVESIAAAYSVSVQDLMLANGLESDLIRVDQKLIIPAGPLPRGPDGRPLPTDTPTPVSAIYKVQVRSGDTLESIAQQLKTTVDAIIAANDWIENADTIIRPGDEVIVPVGAALPTPTLAPDLRPTDTPVPTPTPTPGTRWPAPQLLSPANGAHFGGGSVLLQWLSVGLLAPNEVYVVRVMPEGQARDELTSVTIGTSFRVPQDWLQQQQRRSQRFLWSVQVARDIRAIASQASGLRATSPASSPRAFFWESND